MEFERPWLLWVAVAAAALAAWAARRRPAGLSPARHLAAAALRSLGILAALFAAAGPHRLEAEPRPRQTLWALAAPGEPGERLPGDTAPPVRSSDPSVPRAVAGALAGRAPEADARLVAVLGDPGAGEAAAVEALRAARGLGIPVFVRPAPPPAASAPAPAPPPRPWLEGFGLPPVLASGVPFEVRPLLSAEGREDPGATVSLALDGKVVGEWRPSDPRPVLTLPAGHHLLAAEVRDGSGASRGSVSGTVAVPGPPAVLVVEEGAAPSPLSGVLSLQGLPVTRCGPGAIPDLAPFSVVVLGAGAAGDAAVEREVRNGKGLLVTGAPKDARGLGRFRGGAVARALPVFLPPPPPPEPPPPEVPPPEEKPPPGKGPEVRRDEGERPGAVVTLLLLVDSSGSMWGPKIEMARRAGAAAAATLSPQDRFGMISFSDDPRWRVPLGPAGDDDRIGEALRTLEAGGGTNLLPALQEARRALRREATAVRHVIVLSDGETPPFGLRPVVEGMVAEGATLSTVGIGTDFDARLLGSLSTWGRGRTFPAVDPESIPRVVTLDTQRIVAAGKEAVEKARPTDLPPPPVAKKEPEPERKPPPQPPRPPARSPVEAADPCAILEGTGPWPGAVPPEETPEARLATTLALRFAGRAGPALVLGRHGLGRTAAFTFDPADWAAWEGFGPAAARVVRGLAPAESGAPVELIGVDPGPGGTVVRFEVRGGEGPVPAPRVEALDPAGDSPAAVPVAREGARRFAASVPRVPGGGPRTLVVRAGGASDPGEALGWFDPGPALPRPPDPGAPARIAEAAGAVLLGPGAAPPALPGRPGAPRKVPRGLAALVLAASLLVLDTALRRVRRG